MTASMNLPTELVLQILQIASYSSRVTSQSLSQVSRWVRELVLPDLWSTIILLEKADESFSLTYADVHKVFVHAAPFDLTLIPMDALRYVHSLYIIPPPGDLNELSQSLILILKSLLQALPGLRRLSAPLSAKRAYRRFPALGKELKISASLIAELDLQADCSGYLYVPFELACGNFKNVTHLRVGTPVGDGARVYAWIVACVPAITHFAFDCPEESLGPILFQDENGCYPNVLKVLQPKMSRSLTYVLILLRENEATNKVAAGEALDRVKDDRLVIMWMPADCKDDWKLWEKLAREDRNIWDEALARRRERRGALP